MADYFVASGGSNTAPYDTWAKAATSLATALAAATVTADRVVIQYNGVPSGDAEVAADTTYTFAAAISLIASTNSGTSTITPTAMGTANWIGNSTTNRTVTFNGAFKVFIYGITVRTAGSTADTINIGSTTSVDGAHYELENVYLWQGNSNSAQVISLGHGGGNDINGYIALRDCTFRFGATGQAINLRSNADMINCTVSSDGSAPTGLFVRNSTDNSGCVLRAIGCDFSFVGSGNLVKDHTSCGADYFIDRCRLGSGMTILASQTVTNKGSARVFISDCANGDVHSAFEYHDAFGSLTVSTAIYQNDAALSDGTTSSDYSWKIVTTANCSTWTPFVSPWIDAFNDDVATAITPYFEILRDGSATAYQDDEVWGEWAYKGTSGNPIATLVNDRMAVAGAAANQAASALGASDWTGENATAWFGKLAPGSSFTPAEIGDVSARVYVGLASATVYVTPVIQGLQAVS